MTMTDTPLSLRLEDQALIYDARVVMEHAGLTGVFRSTLEAIIVERRGLEPSIAHQPERLTAYAELVLREYVALAKPFMGKPLDIDQRVMLARRAIRIMILGGFGSCAPDDLS